jgi:conjugative transfer signal peptidase TraF
MQKLSVYVLCTTVFGVALIGSSLVTHPSPWLVWNASASVPIGFYHVVSGAPKRGDFVLVHTPDSVEMLADARNYLPVGVPLVKHIAAVVGDDVCALNSTVTINGKVVANQLEADRAGRPLPRWNGCRKLDRDEYFLMTEAADSFDSRYFGPVARANIIGRLVPLWTE